jgi:hypothetical protein
VKLAFAFLADAATMLPNGTFDVIAGGFDMILGKTFPATKSAMVFIARVLFEPQECGREHQFVGNIVNSEGQPIFPQFLITGTPPPHSRHPGRDNSFSVCFSAERVDFPTPGEYFFRLTIDGNPLGDVMIEVVSEEQPK